MKSLFSIIIFSFFTVQLLAQTKNPPPQYSNAFKVYVELSDVKKVTVETSLAGDIRTTTERHTAFQPIMAWMKYRKKGRFFEIALTKFNFSRNNTQTEVQLLPRDSFGNVISNVLKLDTFLNQGADISTTHIGYRMEWNIPIFYDEKRSFQSYIGISTAPSFYAQKIKPHKQILAAFPLDIADINNTFTIIPRLTYAFTKRLFMDINVPISFMELNARYRFEDNPILPTYARKTVNFTARLPTNIWAIRLGIGYKI